MNIGQLFGLIKSILDSAVGEMDNDVTDLKSAINQTNSELYGSASYRLEFKPGTYEHITVGSTLIEYHGGSYDQTRKILKDVTYDAACKVNIAAKTGYCFSCYIAQSGVIQVAYSQITSFTLEPGIQYGIILRASDGTTNISSLSVDQIVEIEYVSNDTNAIEGLEERVIPLENEIDDLLFEHKQIDVTNNTYSAWITELNKWQRANKCAMMPIQDNVEIIEITANNSYPADVAFLTSTAHNGNTSPSYVSDTDKITIPSGNKQRLSVPSSAKYLYVFKNFENSESSYIPSSINYITRKNTDFSIPLGLHEMPESTNILNIIKRCRQLTDIKWTPAVDLSRYMLVQTQGSISPDTAESQNYLGIFKAGVEYTGVPYGRVNATMTSYGYNYATVGHYIGLDTFISSVSNPKSLLSFNNVGSVTNHRSVRYATVCSGLTCYALDVSEVPTANIPNISGLTYIGKLNNSGTLLSDNLIKIGDVLNKYDYHTAIITDIVRDSDGLIQLVELSDASPAGLADKNYDEGKIGGLCRRKGWTKNQLFAEGSWGDYSVYRYSGTVTYTPSPYVNVGDEFDGWNIEHFPIMPYEGENFNYKTGYIPNDAIKLVITLAGYDFVRVFKDGTEITGSPFAVTTTNDAINPISVTEIGVGDYTAYLCNISEGDVTNLTYACHWSVITF